MVVYHFFAAALIVNLRAAFTIETSKKYYEPFRQTATPTPPPRPRLLLALTVTEHFQLECTSCWREIPLTCKIHAVECISKKETERERVQKNRKSSKNQKNNPKFYKADSTLARARQQKMPKQIEMHVKFK